MVGAHKELSSRAKQWRAAGGAQPPTGLRDGESSRFLNNILKVAEAKNNINHTGAPLTQRTLWSSLQP